jgi:ubiquinone/menaquinone biosynthesis C-methylase UbiE
MDWPASFFTGPYQREYFEYTADTERTAHEADFIQAQLELTSTSHVLDLACGSGRHALALSSRVAHITGVDLTPAFLNAASSAAAEQGAANVEFLHGDMRALDHREQFDAAYNYFTAWGYYSDTENFDVLARVQRALKPEGRFLLEIINRDTLMRHYSPRDYSRKEDGTVCLEERAFNHEQGRAYNRRVYLYPDGRREEICFDHYLPSADALIRHLCDAGFSAVHAVEAPSGNPLGIESWRMAVIGTK